MQNQSKRMPQSIKKRGKYSDINKRIQPSEQSASEQQQHGKDKGKGGCAGEHNADERCRKERHRYRKCQMSRRQRKGLHDLCAQIAVKGRNHRKQIEHRKIAYENRSGTNDCQKRIGQRTFVRKGIDTRGKNDKYGKRDEPSRRRFSEIRLEAVEVQPCDWLVGKPPPF